MPCKVVVPAVYDIAHGGKDVIYGFNQGPLLGEVKIRRAGRVLSCAHS